jgi:hypothetical protein
MRQFHGLIFFGSFIAKQENDALIKEIAEALVTAGALQQPAHSESKEQATKEALIRQRATSHLEDVVRDIAAALLGKEIVFGADLPYPPWPSNLTMIDNDLSVEAKEAILKLDKGATFSSNGVFNTCLDYGTIQDILESH